MNKFEAVLLISPEVSNNLLEQNIKNFEDIVTKQLWQNYEYRRLGFKRS